VDRVGDELAQSELAVPILIKNEAIAIINIESERENAFSSSDQHLVETHGAIPWFKLLRVLLKKMDHLKRVILQLQFLIVT